MKRVLSVICVFALAIAAWGATDASDKDTIAQANALVHGGEIQKAQSLLQTAVDANPNSELLHEALGELFFEQRKFEDTVRELTLALQINPNSRRYGMMLAGALINWQHFGVAVDFLQAARPNFGKYPEFHHYLAVAYFNMNRIPDAKAEAKETLRIAPDFERAQFLLAMCQMSQAETDAALANYRDLAKKHPENPIYWSTLAQTLVKLGDKNDVEALRAGKRALAIAPDNPMALSATGTVLTRMGNFAEARPIYEKLAKIDPTAIVPHAALARIYTRLGNRALAQRETETLDKLRAQNPTNANDGTAAPQ